MSQAAIIRAERDEPPQARAVSPGAGFRVAPGGGRPIGMAAPLQEAAAREGTGGVGLSVAGSFPGGAEALLTPYHRDEIKRLALRHGMPVAQVAPLYAAKLQDLSRHATVSGYLPLLVEKHVRDVISSSNRSGSSRPRS